MAAAFTSDMGLDSEADGSSTTVVGSARRSSRRDCLFTWIEAEPEVACGNSDSENTGCRDFGLGMEALTAQGSFESCRDTMGKFCASVVIGGWGGGGVGVGVSWAVETCVTCVTAV